MVREIGNENDVITPQHRRHTALADQRVAGRKMTALRLKSLKFIRSFFIYLSDDGARRRNEEADGTSNDQDLRLQDQWQRYMQ